MNDDDSPPAICQPSRGRTGERRLPGAEELGACGIEWVDGEIEAFTDAANVRLAWKVPAHRASAIGERIADYWDLRWGRLRCEVAAQSDSATDGDQYHRRRSSSGCSPPAMPRAPPWRAYLLDAPPKTCRCPDQRFAGERAGDAPLQRQLALASRTCAQVLLDGLVLFVRQLAVGKRRHAIPDEVMIEARVTHPMCSSVGRSLASRSPRRHRDGEYSDVDLSSPLFVSVQVRC
ncbi:MAG TPA: hypothetical protein VG496_05475 [Myxococcales bacterium]|nr:hypothetical protein [Myxococcales bacterium]